MTLATCQCEYGDFKDRVRFRTKQLIEIIATETQVKPAHVGQVLEKEVEVAAQDLQDQTYGGFSIPSLCNISAVDLPLVDEPRQERATHPFGHREKAFGQTFAEF